MFIIPSYQKWFSNLGISQIIVETLKKLYIEFPEPTVNIADIRRKFHRAVDEVEKTKSKKRK